MTIRIHTNDPDSVRMYLFKIRWTQMTKVLTEEKVSVDEWPEWSIMFLRIDLLPTMMLKNILFADQLD